MTKCERCNGDTEAKVRKLRGKEYNLCVFCVRELEAKDEGVCKARFDFYYDKT